MNSPIEYEYKSTCEDVVNTTGTSNRNDAHTDNNNACYRSYAEATRETIKSPMASPQDFVGGTRNPEVPGRS